MNVSWRELIVLLRNDSVSSDVINEAIADSSTAGDLPDLIDDIVVKYLVTNDVSTRLNASLLIAKVFTRFRASLVPLLADTLSDGLLFSLDSLDLQRVGSERSNFLYSGKTSFVA